MDSNPATLIAINEELGNNFDDLITRCEKYKQVLLNRKHEITEKVTRIWRVCEICDDMYLLK